MKKFRLSAEAAGDLTEIFDYIAEDSIAAAQRVRAGIHDQLKKLAQTPGMGHRRRAPRKAGRAEDSGPALKSAPLEAQRSG